LHLSLKTSVDQKAAAYLQQVHADIFIYEKALLYNPNNLLFVSSLTLKCLDEHNPYVLTDLKAAENNMLRGHAAQLLVGEVRKVNPNIPCVLLPENLHTYFELSAQAWTLYKAP
jgi:hypothetical protein